MFDDDAYYYRMEMGNDYQLPAGLYTFDRPIDQNPTKALFFGAGKLAVSNQKDSQGRWIWSTWATGDGMVADVITSGVIQADLIKAGILAGGNGRVTLDMTTGALNVDGDLVYDPVTRILHIGGTANINAANIKSGVINSARIPNLSADKITTGTIDAQTINVTKLNASNLNRGTVGTSVSNTSCALYDGWKSARIDGSATGVNANSSTFFFDYAKNAFISEGRITARPEGHSHHLELNGLSLNTAAGYASMKVWSTYVQMMGHGPFRFETGIEANNHVRLLGKDIALGSDGNVKWS